MGQESMKYTEEMVSDAMELLPTLWILKHQIKNESGVPIEFENHKFMYEPYNDLSPFQVILKAPQVGATTKDIIKSFWVANKMRKDIIYTLPTQGDVNEMAGGKVNRIVAQNPILRRWVKDHDSVEQKAVGNNLIYYRGTFTNRQAMMVSSDLNIHDEVDASDPSVITQYETRLQAKSEGWRWYFSHPTIAGFGVDIYWQQSDKKEWFVKCEYCSTEQVLSWPGNINVSRETYCCSSCGGDMKDRIRINGKWKKTAVGLFSGWHMSQMMCPWISASAIIKAKNDPLKDEQYFYNYILGLPYVGSENKILPEVVLKNVTTKVNDRTGPLIIGVDTGLPIHYVLMNKQGAFYQATCKAPSATYDPYKHLETYLNGNPNAYMVFDQGGDLIGPRQLQAKYPGHVFLCHYRKDRKTTQVVTWGVDKEMGNVVVDRNRMIQLMVEQMRDHGRIRLNGKEEDWKPLATHFGNIYRVSKETPFGTEYVWERNGPDHFVHALLYAMVGLDRFSDMAATIIDMNQFADIPQGRIFNE